MKSARPDTWMPLYIGDYLADTQHLTRSEHGAYLLLIMAYWRNGGPLPDNAKHMQCICKASAKDWQSLASTVSSFFEVGEEVWRHKRIDQEMERAAAGYAKRSAAAMQRWSNADALHEQPQPQPPSKKESPSPIGLVPQTAEALNVERPKRPSPKRIFSDDWQPSDQDRQHAHALGLDPDGEARGCKNHSIANGKPYANHSRAYRNWCDKSAEFRASSGGRGRVQRQPSSIAEATASVIAAAARAGKSAGGNGASGYGGGPLPQPHGQPSTRPDGPEIDDWGFVGGADGVPSGRGENGSPQMGEVIEMVADAGGDPGGMPVAGRAPQANAQGHEVKAGKP